MENNNLIAIKSLLSQENVVQKMTQILGRNASAFLSSVSVLAQTTELKDCDKMSILSAAIAAASLNLQVNPNLGQACIIPYNNKTGKVAQFQIMKKGFIQLAQRSGVFLTINEVIVYEGEYQVIDKLSGKFDLNGTKTSETIIGYAAYFELINGFSKSLYMTKQEVEKHGLRFSKTYKKGYGNWKDSFDDMALKTVLKLLLSRYAPLSSDMQLNNAMQFDQAKLGLSEDLEITQVEYVDNDEKPEQTDPENIKPIKR